MFNISSSKLMYQMLSLMAVTAMGSLYADYPYPPPHPNPNIRINQGPSNQPTGQANIRAKGREEIAFNGNADNRPIYQTLHRGDWDYRENWKYDRDAYLTGINQSQFDERLRPEYGYGPYPAPEPYTHLASNVGITPPGTNSINPLVTPNSTYYSSSFPRPYNPPNPTTPSISSYSSYPGTSAYSQFGYSGYNPTYAGNYTGGAYSQPNSLYYGYEDYAMRYPQQGINTGYGANNYGYLRYRTPNTVNLNYSAPDYSYYNTVNPNNPNLNYYPPY